MDTRTLMKLVIISILAPLTGSERLLRVSSADHVRLTWALDRDVTDILRFYFTRNKVGTERDPLLLATLFDEQGQPDCLRTPEYGIRLKECGFDGETKMATLVLAHVTDAATTGHFTCMSPSNGTTESIRLFIYKPPKIEVEDVASSPEMTPQTLRLSCRAVATSHPAGDRLPIQYSWLRSGVELRYHDLERHLANGAEVTISPAYREDCAAEFVCVAREEGASESISSRMRIECSKATLEALHSMPGPDKRKSDPSFTITDEPVPRTTLSRETSRTRRTRESNSLVVALATVGAVVFVIGVVNILVCVISKRRSRGEDTDNVSTYEMEPDVCKLPTKCGPKSEPRSPDQSERPLPSLPHDARPSGARSQAPGQTIYLEIMSSMEVTPDQIAAAFSDQGNYEVPRESGGPTVTQYHNMHEGECSVARVAGAGIPSDVLYAPSTPRACARSPRHVARHRVDVTARCEVGDESSSGRRDGENSTRPSSAERTIIRDIYLITDTERFAQRELEYVNGRLRQMTQNEPDSEYITTKAVSLTRNARHTSE